MKRLNQYSETSKPRKGQDQKAPLVNTTKHLKKN